MPRRGWPLCGLVPAGGSHEGVDVDVVMAFVGAARRRLWRHCRHALFRYVALRNEARGIAGVAMVPDMRSLAYNGGQYAWRAS